jgi:hypothetical protein
MDTEGRPTGNVGVRGREREGQIDTEIETDRGPLGPCFH